MKTFDNKQNLQDIIYDDNLEQKYPWGEERTTSNNKSMKGKRCDNKW